jgi:hypothetical protein
MRLLVLGGTVVLGRHVAAGALARGHEVTLFTRGRHGAGLFREAEHVRGTAPIGQTTMGEVLAAAGDAELRWISDEALEAAGVEARTELPLWLPARFAGTWAVGTERAQAAGLRCRPVAETVADVAAWLRAGGEAELPDWRAEMRPPPMSGERERELLALAR